MDSQKTRDCSCNDICTGKRFLVEEFQEVVPNGLILSSGALTMGQESNVDGVLREAYGFEAIGNSIHA